MVKLTKKDAVAINGHTGVFIGSWTSRVFGITPSVNLTVGVLNSATADRQTVKLTPSEARRVAIAILEEAEKVDDKSD